VAYSKSHVAFSRSISRVVWGVDKTRDFSDAPRTSFLSNRNFRGPSEGTPSGMLPWKDA